MSDRVRSAPNSELNRRLDEERLERVAAMVGKPAFEITKQIEDLDRVWDVERELAAGSALAMADVAAAPPPSR